MSRPSGTRSPGCAGAAERCDPSHPVPPIVELTIESMDDDAAIWIAAFADGSGCYVSASQA
jgi:hypothetical protein